MGFAGRTFARLKREYVCFLTIATALMVSQRLATPTKSWRSFAHSFSNVLGVCPSQHWWDCPHKLPPHQRFNKTILYLKPHKTGSETFKEVLLRIADYYNLSTDKELDWKLQKVTSQRQRRALLRNQYDILLRHSRYRQNLTERRIRGRDHGRLLSQDQNSTAHRALLKIVTIRNPIDRLFSHYFSQRRFRSFIPKRGFVRPGRLSEDEEISDFEEWLRHYPRNQQLFYNRDVSAWPQGNVEGDELLKAVHETVDFYDHVIVADQWKQSLCLFGFIEKIHPSLLALEKRNANGVRARRFRKTSALSNRSLYAKVTAKIEYDFLLYHALLAKYNEKLGAVESTDLGRYCDRVSAEAKTNNGKTRRNPKKFS